MIPLPFDWKTPEGLITLWSGIARALGYRIERSPDGGTDWEGELVDGWTLYYPSGTTDFIDDNVLRSIAVSRLKTMSKITHEDFARAQDAAITEESAWAAWREMQDGDGYVLPQWGRSLNDTAQLLPPAGLYFVVAERNREIAVHYDYGSALSPADRTIGWQSAMYHDTSKHGEALAAVWAAAWYQCHLTLEKGKDSNG